MKVAFVHEWFGHIAGSEQVLEAMHAEFPEADLFALIDVTPEAERPPFLRRRVQTSFLQKIPFVGRYYRMLLPLMPMAVEQLNLSGYDLVISNSHAVAKGVLLGPDQLHICMCHSPVRYAWDLQDQYLSGSRLGPLAWLARWQLHKLRVWDSRTANGVDHFIANSHYIARRIRRVYRREATVIYPNVDTGRFTPGEAREDFYLAASRVVPYKRLPLIAEAFARMPDKKLVIIGGGPGLKALQSSAPPNVKVMGYQPFEVLLEHMRKAKAFVFAAEEDFGIVPIEAQACGTPVIAFGKGGAAETVVDGVTGVHFHEQTAEAICEAVGRFEAQAAGFDPEVLRAQALKFSTERFRREFRAFVEAKWAAHQADIASHLAGRPTGTA